MSCSKERNHSRGVMRQWLVGSSTASWWRDEVEITSTSRVSYPCVPYSTATQGHGSVKEGNVLLNDALNTFHLRLYGVRLIVKDHSNSERGNPLSPHGLLFPISSKGSFICIIPQTEYHIPRPLLHQSWSTGWNEIAV